MSKDLTPLMKQYWEIKSLHKDKILFFRMGDFFEIFYDDAVLAAPLLGITLTQRNKKSEDTTPMCGMPHHSVANPINKLLSLGHKVALCDQIEDPKFAKGIVKRAVTRILTPGMVYDTDQINAADSHYIMCFDHESLSLIDATTGEAYYFLHLSPQQREETISLLPIAEAVFLKNQIIEIEKFKKNHSIMTISEIDQSVFDNKNWPLSANVLFTYVSNLATEQMHKVIRPFEKRTLSGRLEVGFNSIKHLEIFTNYKGEEKGSLFFAINKTLTSSGARKLKYWLRFPLSNQKVICERQISVINFRNHLYELKKTREILPQMGDIERRLSKIAQPQRHARDLMSLAESIRAGLKALDVTNSILKYHQELNITFLQNLYQKIISTIIEGAPLSTKQGHIIQKEVSPELDELIELSTNAQGLIQNLENQEKQNTGINSLKIRYNSVFGYYIEITNTHKDKVPQHYQRKQTLTNGERYYTVELIDLERKVLSAQTRRNELESAIFEDLVKVILNEAPFLTQLSDAISEIDVYSSLAWLSLEQNYCQPVFSLDRSLDIKASRHPVVEQYQKELHQISKFVANDILLKPRDCYLITGPNMAGKSTLMRQVALTVIMAQIGSFVPASFARLPIYESIFTRIGASDQLTEGLSTFMVEMTETADLLHHAGPNSLLILDEVGRGTSTFDGMCLAQSILEYIIKNLKSHVLFATHYHELVKLENKYDEIKNVHMKISELNGQIDFRYLLSSGSAEKSYGVQVAELAGLPTEVIQKAYQLLQKFEGDSMSARKNQSETVKVDQLKLFQN